MGNESLAGLEGRGDKPPRLWPCHMLSNACLANSGLLPTQRAAGTGETAGLWVLLAVWSGRVPGTSWPWPSKVLGPQACHQGVACCLLAPPSLAPTSTTPPPLGGQSAQPGSTKVSSATHNFHPSPPQASLPIYTQLWRRIPSPQTSGWSSGQGSLAQMRKQTCSERSNLPEATACSLQGWP